jgi:hypothetical protein
MNRRDREIDDRLATKFKMQLGAVVRGQHDMQIGNDGM